jgi:hypothetical protein
MNVVLQYDLPDARSAPSSASVDRLRSRREPRGKSARGAAETFADVVALWPTPEPRSPASAPNRASPRLRHRVSRFPSARRRRCSFASISASRRSGLDPVVRLHRDQRRRYDNALIPVTGQQPVNYAAARASFVAEAEPPATFTEPRRHLTQDLGTVLENPALSYFAAAATLHYCNTYCRLVHVHPTKVISSIRSVPHA